jgi:MYXO-CTERM domain-containing protein
MLGRLGPVVAVPAVLLAHREAAACTPAPCTPAQVAPAAGSVPSGAPALAFVRTAGWALPPPHPDAGPQTFRILDPQGAEVPAATLSDPWWGGATLLIPVSPLPVAAGYQVAYDEACTRGWPETPTPRRPSFDVVAPVSLPTSPGTLRPAHRVVGPRTVFAGGGLCYATVEAVAIDVAIDPTPELLAHRALAGFAITVDGQPHSRIFYGDAPLGCDGLLHVRTLHAACGARGPGEHGGSPDYGLTLGEHTVAVRAHVAGAAGDTSEVSTTLTFSCADAGAGSDTRDAAACAAPDASADASTEAGSSVDAGVDAADAADAAASDSGSEAAVDVADASGRPAAAAVDGSIAAVRPDAAIPPAPATSVGGDADSGCSAASSGAPSGSAFALLAAVLAAVRRRSRRRSR